MVTDYEFSSTYRVDSETFEKFNDAYESLLVLAEDYLNTDKEAFVVIIDNTTFTGQIESRDVYVSQSYIHIANLISSFDYLSNTAVNIYSVLGNEYCSIKHKIFNDICYDSYANCKVSRYDFKIVVRKFWDIGTTIYF